MLTLEAEAQVGELGSLLEIIPEPHRYPSLCKLHLGPILGNLMHRLPPNSTSNVSLRMTLRYTGNIPDYHSQVDTGNSPAQVNTGKIYLKFKYYVNRLVPSPCKITVICLRSTYFFHLRLTCTHTSYKGL